MTSRRKHWCEERRVLAWADDELRVRRRAGSAAQTHRVSKSGQDAVRVLSGALYQRAGC